MQAPQILVVQCGYGRFLRQLKQNLQQHLARRIPSRGLECTRAVGELQGRDIEGAYCTRIELESSSREEAIRKGLTLGRNVLSRGSPDRAWYTREQFQSRNAKIAQGLNHRIEATACGSAHQHCTCPSPDVHDLTALEDYQRIFHARSAD